MDRLISFVFIILLLIPVVPLIIIAFLGTIIAALLRIIALAFELPVKLLALIGKQIEVESNILRPKEDK